MSHAEELPAAAARYCVTGSDEKKEMFRTIPTMASCTVDVVKQTVSDRILSMDCTRADIHRKSIYELDYADDNSYRETISGTAELKIGAAGQSYSPKSLMKTEGEFLGADCGAFGAKSLKELGITPAFMSAMAGGG